jgi:hypothetical protein
VAMAVARAARVGDRAQLAGIAGNCVPAGRVHRPPPPGASAPT